MNILKKLISPFTILAGKVDHSVQQKILASVLRHVTTAGAGALVAHGYLNGNDTTQFVGCVLGLIGMLSGAQQKHDEAVP